MAGLADSFALSALFAIVRRTETDRALAHGRNANAVWNRSRAVGNIGAVRVQGELDAFRRLPVHFEGRHFNGHTVRSANGIGMEFDFGGLQS